MAYCFTLQDVCRFSEEAQDHEDLRCQRSRLVSFLILQPRHSWIHRFKTCWLSTE